MMGRIQNTTHLQIVFTLLQKNYSQCQSLMQTTLSTSANTPLTNSIFSSQIRQPHQPLDTNPFTNEKMCSDVYATYIPSLMNRMAARALPNLGKICLAQGCARSTTVIIYEGIVGRSMLRPFCVRFCGNFFVFEV